MICPVPNCLRPSRTGGSSFTHGGGGVVFVEKEDENGEKESGVGCATDGCLFLRQDATLADQKKTVRGRDERLERTGRHSHEHLGGTGKGTRAALLSSPFQAQTVVVL